MSPWRRQGRPLRVPLCDCIGRRAHDGDARHEAEPRRREPPEPPGLQHHTTPVASMSARAGMIAPPGWRFDRTDEAALIPKDPRAPLAPQQTCREVFDEGSRYYPAICVARISTR